MASNGYLKVKLFKKTSSKMFYIHQIVAQVFISKCKNKTEINHINGIKTDNRVENLEWCTHSENIKHAYNTGLIKLTQKKRENSKRLAYELGKKYGKQNVKKVNQYDLQGNFIKTWNSITEAIEKLKIQHISDCCKGKRKTAGGYKWKYKDTQ